MKLRTALVIGGIFSAQLATAQPAPSTASSTTSIQDQWNFSITPYLWGLGVTGSLSNNVASKPIKATLGDLLSDIKFLAMIVAEARTEKFGLYLDALYGDLGKSTAVVLGRPDLNSNVSANLSMITLAPNFRLYSSKSSHVDGLIGARYLGLNTTVTISDPALNVSSKSNITENITTAIAGVKGRLHLGDSNYFVPFYVDAGGGQHSSFTSQAYLGIGRTYDWGDVSLAAKNVYYQFKLNNAKVDLNMLGAAVGVTFRF